MPTSFLADRPDQLMTTLHAVQSTGMKSNSKRAIVKTSFDLLQGVRRPIQGAMAAKYLASAKY
jgi:hypothetical protein